MRKDQAQRMLAAAEERLRADIEKAQIPASAGYSELLLRMAAVGGHVPSAMVVEELDARRQRRRRDGKPGIAEIARAVREKAQPAPSSSRKRKSAKAARKRNRSR